MILPRIFILPILTCISIVLASNPEESTENKRGNLGKKPNSKITEGVFVIDKQFTLKFLESAKKVTENVKL